MSWAIWESNGVLRRLRGKQAPLEDLMIMARWSLLAGVWLLLAGLLAGCCARPAASQVTGGTPGVAGQIRIDGSSTVFPISEAMGEEFEKKHPGLKVSVGVSGTGGGFKKFCSAQEADRIDIADASRPITPVELEACQKQRVEFIELPVAYDGIAVVVNPKNTWASCLTVAELRRIWEPQAQAVVTNWRQVRASFPDKRLKLYGPGIDSGTFDYFTEAIVGKAKASRGDFTPSEDDNVLVQGVTGNEGGLGYFGFAYYEANQDRVNLVAIDAGDGRCVLPSMETIRGGTYTPLSRPLFIYVSIESARRPEVQEFVRFYLTNAPRLVQEVGYVPLPEVVYRLALERFTKGKTGSLFAGRTVGQGVSLEDLLKE